MNTKVIKIIFSILICIAIVSISYSVFAIVSPNEVEIGDDLPEVGELEKLGEDVLGIIQIVGIVVMVLILIFLGIKYMTGSVEDKAGYKKALVPYVVGCLILFAAPTIANVVYEMSDFEKEKASIVVTWYCDNCGVIILKGDCKCSVSEPVQGYRCTGCERRVYKQPHGRVYCIDCGVEL